MDTGTRRRAFLALFAPSLGAALACGTLGGCGPKKPPPMPAPEYEEPAQPVPAEPARSAAPSATPSAAPSSIPQS